MGPDDEVTPVEKDPYWRPPRRDSQPPHPVASPAPGFNALGLEAKTNPGGIASNAYVKRKLRRHSTVAGSIIALLTGSGGVYAYRDAQGNAIHQARAEQQLKDHIAEETQHYAETTKRLDQLLELELKRHEKPGEHR